MLSKIKNLLPAITVLTISSVLLLTRLGQNSLADWDEAWYADASRFMFENDHFLTPIWNNQYFFDKPPLQYWLTQPFLYFFGETELAYRLPSALAAIGLTLITYLWGIHQKTSQRWNNLTALSAAIILLSFPHFLGRARSGNFDSLFVFLTTLSMFLMIKNRPALGGIFLGLSWLTKGVFSGLFPIVVFFLLTIKNSFQTSRRAGREASDRTAVDSGSAAVELMPADDSSRLEIKSLILYIFFAVLIYAPWHLLQYSRFERLINQSYFATFDQGEFGSWNWMDIAWRFDLRYLVFLWTFLRLWFPFLLISLIYQVTSSLRVRRQAGVAISLPFITFLVIFLALSAAKSKNDWYIMPAYPFIALMIADLFNQITSFAPKLLSKLAVILLLISLSNLYLYRRQAFPLDKWLPEKELGLTVKNLTGPDDLIVTAEYEFPTLRYYSERQVRTAAPQPDYQGKYWWIWDNADIATALRHGQNIVTIHRPGTEWQIEVPGFYRQELGDVNGRIISRLLPN